MDQTTLIWGIWFFKWTKRRSSGAFGFSNGPNEARLGHLIFQMS
jgi:hypothetical protein